MNQGIEEVKRCSKVGREVEVAVRLKAIRRRQKLLVVEAKLKRRLVFYSNTVLHMPSNKASRRTSASFSRNSTLISVSVLSFYIS